MFTHNLNIINNKLQNPTWSLFCKAQRQEAWRKRRGLYSAVQVKQRKKNKKGEKECKGGELQIMEARKPAMEEIWKPDLGGKGESRSVHKGRKECQK